MIKRFSLSGVGRLTFTTLTASAFVLTGCSDSSDSRPGTPEPEPVACMGTEVNPERLFLQQLDTDSVIVKWRGDADGGDGADSVCFGTDQDFLPEESLTAATETETGHMEALLTGLSPDTTYYYSVGGAGSAGDSRFFQTPPEDGAVPADGNTHIFIVGDSGTVTDGVSEELPEGEHPGEAAAVLAGYQTYSEANGGEPVDLFLALGDNAYEVGTDEEWQKSFFELYTDILSSAYTIPTIGNHEMGYGEIDLCIFVPSIPCGSQTLATGGVSASSDPDSYDSDGDLTPDGTGMPYLDIFTLPADGESGGVSSGTEQYYSIDYGNVHVVSLDSQLSARDDTARAAMKDWLVSDLSANDLDWTIVIFHHPPYSKGENHDSDDANRSPIDLPMWDMRNEFTPVFEEYGVDVVYSGHSHSYERSYYLRGHTGTSDTFSAAAHAELIDDDPDQPASGREGEAYEQLSPTSGGIDDRVVYTVAGNAGKADYGGDSFGITDDDEWLRHAAHIEQPFSDTECDSPEGCREGLRGLGVKGSVVIDADSDSLRARFVDLNGDVLDEFTINR
jgi:hypothetical protein